MASPPKDEKNITPQLKFRDDEEAFMYFKKLGEELGFTGSSLQRFMTSRVEEHELKWKLYLEASNKQKEKEHLQKEKEIQLALEQTREKQELAKLEHEKQMKELEIKEKIELKALEKEIEEKKIQEQDKQRQHEKEIQDENYKRSELEKDKDREHELRLKDMETRENLQKAETEALARQERKENKDKKYIPKMPPYKEDKDSIDSFLYRYEIMAKEHGWSKEKWGTYLGNYLEGAALSLYHRLSANEGNTYDIIKSELLFKFQCNAEGFLEKFRNGKPQIDESYKAYYTRLAHLLDRWLELAEIPKTFDGLYDFIIYEQMMASSCKELQIYLKERQLKFTKDIIDSSNAYRSAHPGIDLAKKGQIILGSNTQQTGNAAKKCNQLEHDLYAGSDMYSQEYDPQMGASSYGYNIPGRGQNQNRHMRRGYLQGPPRGRYPQDARREGNTSDRNYFGGRGNGPFKGNSQHRPTCNYCGKEGHLQKDCWHFKNQAAIAAIPAQLGSACAANVPTAKGIINGKPGIVMRDTGASVAGIRRSFVQANQYLPRKMAVQLFDGQIKEFPLAKIHVESPFYNGSVECCVIDAPPYDLVLGNVDGTKSGDLILASTALGCVTTRAQNAKEFKQKVQLKAPNTSQLGVSKDELIKLQKNDESLKQCFETLKKSQYHAPEVSYYTLEDDILKRNFQDKTHNKIKQIVVPKPLRQSLLEMAHDSMLTGHGGVRRTIARLYTNFFWPGIHSDVKKFCRSCDRCQKTAPKPQNIPLDYMPIITEPFSRIAIDITGPLSPPSEEGHRFILSVVDIGTRFPEAIPLKKIDSITVAEELLKICARMGFPKEILSDNASNFTSDMMKEFYRLLAIQHVRSSPYHAQSNGVVERFHGSIKPMIRKLTETHPKTWHRYLPALLYACRDVPNISTGFAPFDQLFGRRPRGPLDLIANNWTDKDETSPEKTTFQYICDLQDFFKEASKIVENNLDAAAKSNKVYRDRGTRHRKFTINDEVLLLIPDTKNKLLMTWKGPYRVTGCRKNNYLIELKPGVTKCYHANLLKKYYRRNTQEETQDTDDEMQENSDENIDYEEILGRDFVIDEAISCIASVFIPDEEDEVTLHTLPSKDESLDDAKYDDNLNPRMLIEMKKVLEGTPSLYRAEPGTFSEDLQHEIPLTTQQPIRKKQYPLPFTSTETLRKEVDYMEKIGVIERSNSPYSSPVVLVAKPDGTTRVCVDYRDLNQATIFDAEPIPDIEEMFIKLSNKNFFTKVDLSKGFWQIPVHPCDRPKTAFQAPQGLFHFTRMPFGLVTAPATFARMMRMLKLENFSSMNFFDDILTASENWQDHLIHVEGMLKCLERHGLTVRPSKIYAGFQELEFLGHVVGKGKIRPEESKVEKILNIPKPTTKKQIRSLMGLLGYYRRYIPGYSVVTAPITDLLKGKKSVTWTPECEEALKQVQRGLSKQPILILPDLNKPFTVQTDASNVGVAGVLLQVQEGKLHPVAYVSRKLLDRESRYSTIEKECLAIVWTLRKLDRYLWGQKFTLQTDHKPLTFLNTARFKNNRILGWSLTIQGYSFNVKEIAGRDNTLADILSRSGENQVLP